MNISEMNHSLISCNRCERLVRWRQHIASVKRKAYQNEAYWGKPVPGFGDLNASVFVIGLAPGAHGSNRTGRQFTGDGSGDFLFPALYRGGFASQPHAVSADDGLTLTDMYIAPVCRCVPPDNKPTIQEMDNCQTYLETEIQNIAPKVFVILGRIAFDRLRGLAGDTRHLRFSHGAIYNLQQSSKIPSPCRVVCSYHPSRQNTQTGRLTVSMFDEIWKITRDLLAG